MSYKLRPDLTSHLELVRQITESVNAEALYQLSETDIVKLAIERMWKTAYPQRQLPKNLKRKKYIRLQF
jgi:hypothetical protein